ncbi:MAG: DUF1186 domain-containing protein [Acidobacteria bacterium]|nr:DUF1186 domain-containing protein [Acidobacteriota bacterium]
MDKQTYAPPVNQLLKLGEPKKSTIKTLWPDYLALGITAEHIPELIRMACDEELNQAEGDSQEVWAPLHAWRTLGQLRAEAAIEPLLQLWESHDDYSADELPVVYGMIGAASLPALTGFLANQAKDSYARITAASAIEAIGAKHPEARSQCVAILMQQLESFADEDESFNGFLIGSLIGLQAKEAADIIQRAFAADKVDETVVGDAEEVLYDLGVGELSAKKQRQRAEDQRLLEALQSLSLPLFSPSSSSSSFGESAPPPGSSLATHRKSKNKRKQAKKSRKQNRRR